MKKPVPISDNEKWQAVVNCDKSYDSLFLYGVKTTGIFCRPSCKAKTPMRENVIFFENPSYAIVSGFRPCKKCRPDQEVFEPDIELVKKAKDVFDTNYHKSLGLTHISNQLGVSKNHLVRLFKEHYGLTPIEYITKLRVDKAVELLGQADISIIETAYLAGFKSLSNFYKCFKERIGYSPNQYRKNRDKI